MHLQESDQNLMVVVRYKTDLFSPSRISQLLSHYQAMLTHLVTYPERRLSAIPTLKEALPEVTPGKLASPVNGTSSSLTQPNSNQAQPYLPPTNNLELQLTKIWEQVFGIQPIGIRDNFFELGGHSLLAVHMFALIEEQLVGQKLPLATLFQAPTIEQLAQVLRQEGWPAAWSSLVPIQPQGSKPPLFFVHAHGGNVLGYRDLALHLGPDQPFYGLQAQGMDRAEAVPRQIEEIAAHYIKEIRSVQPNGPYFIGGFCLGGEIAFEMAQQLQTAGETVALLVMVQSTHPAYPKFKPGTTWLHRWFYRLIYRFDLELSNFWEVEVGAKWAYTQERAKRLSTTLWVKAEKFIGAVLANFKVAFPHSHAYQVAALSDAHEKAYEAYHPRVYQGAVTLFRVTKQPLGIYPDPTLGWDQCVAGELAVLEVPGHHIGILSKPRVEIVAKQLNQRIDQARNKV